MNNIAKYRPGKSKDVLFEELLDVFPSLVRGVFNKYTKILGRRHITILQYLFLEYLVRYGSTTVKNIAGVFQISVPAASMLAERIIKRGYAVRQKDVHDRRKMIITITDQGRKLRNEIRKERRMAIKDIFSAISLKDLKKYIEILKKLEKNA